MRLTPKPVELMSKHLSKEEINKRREAENKLKGNNDLIKPPSYLSSRQKRIFKFISKELLNVNILNNLDVSLLEVCSIAIDRIREIENKINKNPELLFDNKLIVIKNKYTQDFFKCMQELGLSPSARARLALLNIEKEDKENDPLLKILGDDENDK